MQDLRSKIDKIDDEILKLLTERLSLASQIGEIKKQTSKDISDFEREEQIIERLSQKGNLTKEQITMIYQKIFLLTKQVQREK